MNRQTVIQPLSRNEDSLISHITMNMDAEVQAFADLLPHAVAFVDYTENEFSYLSANKAFQLAFGMHRDIEDMSGLIAKHVTQKNYELLTEMYRKIAKTHQSAECFITWKNEQGGSLYYLVCAQYLGNSAYSTIMISTFTDLTHFGNEEFSLTEASREARTQSRIFTMQELSGYLSLLNCSFDAARLVRPKSMEVVAADADNRPISLPGQCYGFWVKSERCENCTTMDCVKMHQNRYKIERRGEEYYLVASHPVSVYAGGQEPAEDYAIETLTKLTSDILDALHEGEQILTKEKFSRLQELIYEDPLTAVYNRRYFRDMKFLKEPEPGFKPGECIAFVMLDLDNFKKVNDTYGHAVGDQLLIRTAEMLQKRIRTTDSVIRYGGDEFLVVFNSCTEENVRAQILRMQDAISEIRYEKNQTMPMRVSIGYSFRQHFNGGLTEALEMIREADRLMYEDKKRKPGFSPHTSAAENTDC